MALLSSPVNAAVLLGLADGPKSLVDLRRLAGAPSQATLRQRLRELTELGVLTRDRRDGFPRALDYELSAAGRELLPVVEVLRGWLAESPDHPVAFGSTLAKAAIKALLEGWSSRVIRALAAKPLSLTELDRLIASLSYPSLERRLRTMRFAGLIEPLASSGSGTPYTVTNWLRRGAAPLAAAAHWERTNAAEKTAPISRLDIEAAFLLAVPRVPLPNDLSGSCRLVVEISSDSDPPAAGVLVTVDEGKIASCVTRWEGSSDALASGPATTWLAAVLEHKREHLELSGDCLLASALVDGLHQAFSRLGAPLNS